jgi:uncharacterized membrane protein YdbT with pleckstrin-like domain
MLDDPEQIPVFLKDLSLFNSLDEIQIERISRLFTIVDKKPDDVILRQGVRADALYIIMEGQAIVETLSARESAQVDVFVRGDFFGEDSLLRNQPEPASVIALTALSLLRLARDNFSRLIHDFPSVADRLNRFVKSHDYLRRLRFDWISSDEVVYQVRRKHIAFLFVMLILPALVTMIGVGLAGFSIVLSSSTITRYIFFILAAVVVGVGLGWGVWNWIDWGNDYYLITSQRVVWIEKVIGLYESRVEAPLSTVLSVNVNTSFLGRLLGYGNVVVSTFTGKVPLQAVSNPYQMAALVSEYWQRSQQESQLADLNVMRKSVRKILGTQEDETERQNFPQGAKAANRQTPDEFREPSTWEKYFGNIFRTRFEEGRTITYRKHWLILLRKTLVPTLISLVLLSLVVTFDIMYFLNRIRVSSPGLVTFLYILLFLVVFLPWWIYHYIDWRNDIYQVTDRSIFDIERKPFGTESRKSAPLENILSLEHQRPGFVGYFLNVGSVTINVGETKFIFNSVYQPARIQQDVFNHMHALRVQKQREEAARERERILKLIEIYHEEVGKDH